MKNWLFLFSFLLLTACENSTQPPSDTSIDETPVQPMPPVPAGLEKDNPLPPYEFAYRLDNPAATFSLAGKLKEISGLGLTSDGQYLVANNDEQGKIFLLDKTSGKIVNEINFAEGGDYEGIEMVDETVFVVKSDGTVFEVKNPGKPNQVTNTYKTSLETVQDVEGLGYDPNTGFLLLACKGKAGKGDEFKRKRAVYAFDLGQKILVEKPILLIDRDEIQKWADKGKESLTKKLAEFFEPSLANDAFAPSGIALHPLTREFYILSSMGKIVVVLDASGKILHIEPLDPGLHKQPEGICFDRDGTLFISNEGKDGKGKLMRFDMH